MNYQKMNREERYYCFLLGHALLASKTFREKLCALVNESLGREFLNAEHVEVYPEAAWLRDYWYWKIKDQGRLEVLKDILEGAFPEDGDKEAAALYAAFGLGQSAEAFAKITEKPQMKFLRSTKRTANTQGEITSPGLWGFTAITRSGLSDECQFKLARLKWAFNAKPDLMLVSGGKVVLIEAKVESGEDKYTFEFNDGRKQAEKQTEIQQVEIGGLMKCLSKTNSQVLTDVECLFLTKNGKNQLDWKKVISCVLEDDKLAEPEIDAFTKQGFANAKVFGS